MATLDNIRIFGTNYEIADANGRQDYSNLQTSVEQTTGAMLPAWESGAMYSATGIEYKSNAHIRTKFIPVTPGDTYRFDWTAQKPFNIYGFAANTETSAGVNERTAYKPTPYASQPLYYTIPEGVNYIRLQIEATMADDKPTMINMGGSILLDLAGKIIDADLSVLKSAISLNSIYDKSLWEKGHIAGSSGVNGPDNYNRIRTKTFLPDDFVAISVANGYKCWIYCYNEAGVFQGVWTGSTVVKSFSMDYAVQGFAALKTISNSYRYRLVVGDDTTQIELSPENDGDKILFSTFTDATLTKSGVSADAKAVGTALLPNLQCVAITAADATSVYSNRATNLPHNTYSWIAASFFNDMPSDVASTEYGWVFTLSSTLTRGSNGTVKTQMLIFPAPLSTTDEKFKFFFRRIQSGSMSGWVKWPETDTSVWRNELLLPSVNLNDLTGNQCALLISTNIYTNAPFTLGTVFNLVFSSTLSVQFGYQFGTGALFYRRKSTTWGDWVRLTPPNMDAYRTNGKYVAFGDSLTWGAVWSPTSGTAYHQVKAEWRLPTRIALANGMQNNYANEAIGGIGYFKEQDGQTLISQISGYDFSNVELVTVMAGANDHFWTDLGTASDAVNANTICGAIKNIIHTISAKNPKTQIIIIQPPPCGIDGTQYDVWTSKQGDGYVFRWSLAEFDEQVSQLCHNEHVGYLNWWDSTMCRNWEYAGYNGTTGPNFTHPTADYDYCLLGNFIAGKVSALYHGMN